MKIKKKLLKLLDARINRATKVIQSINNRKIKDNKTKDETTKV